MLLSVFHINFPYETVLYNGQTNTTLSALMGWSHVKTGVSLKTGRKLKISLKILGKATQIFIRAVMSINAL